MSKIPVSTLVDVNVSVSGSGATVDRFGIPMIIDTQNIKSATALVPVIGTYTTLASLEAGGFAKYTKAYKLAKQIFAQRKPNPKTFKVASVYALSAAELTAVQSLDSSWYYLAATTVAAGDIEDIADWAQNTATVPVLYHCDSYDTACFAATPSIKTTLATADSWRTFLGCRKVNPQELTLTISAPFVTSNSVVVSINGVALSPTVFATDSNTTLAALATALAGTDAIATAVVTNAGSGSDDDRVIVITAADPLVDVVLSGYVCSLGASQNTATFATVDAGSKPLSTSVIGASCAYPAGVWVAGNKNLAAIEGDDLTLAERNIVIAYGANCYTEIGGVDVVQAGQTSGELAEGVWYYRDIVAYTDRLRATIEDAVYVVLRQSPRLPFNQTGINAVAGAIIAVCNDFVAQGILEPFDPATAFQIPTSASISPSDRSARYLTGISGSLVGSGAIAGVSINLSVVE